MPAVIRFLDQVYGVPGRESEIENLAMLERHVIERPLLDLLKTCLQDGHGSSLAEELFRFGWRPTERSDQLLLLIVAGKGLRVARETLVQSGPVAVEPLIGLLASKGYATMATELLGQIGDPRAVPPLIDKALNDAEARFHAIEALGKIHDVRATDALIRMVTMENITGLVSKGLMRD